MQRRFGVPAQAQLYRLQHRRKAVQFLSLLAVEVRLTSLPDGSQSTDDGLASFIQHPNTVKLSTPVRRLLLVAASDEAESDFLVALNMLEVTQSSTA